MWAVDCLGAVFALAAAEGLRHGPLRKSLSIARAAGALARRRNRADRLRLRRLIAMVDGRFPDGGNCYRRVLAESSLDPCAATEQVFLGLDDSLTPKSGHAWLGVEENSVRTFNAVVAL